MIEEKSALNICRIGRHAERLVSRWILNLFKYPHSFHTRQVIGETAKTGDAGRKSLPEPGSALPLSRSGTGHDQRSTSILAAMASLTVQNGTTPCGSLWTFESYKRSRCCA